MVQLSFYNNRGKPVVSVIECPIDKINLYVNWYDEYNQAIIYMNDDSTRFYVILGPILPPHSQRWELTK